MVETGGLENRLALTGYGGSNPSPSATKSIETVPEKSTESCAIVHHFGPPYRHTRIAQIGFDHVRCSIRHRQAPPEIS